MVLNAKKCYQYDEAISISLVKEVANLNSVTTLLIRALAIIWASPASLIGLFFGTLGLLSGGRVGLRRGCLEFSGGLTTRFLQRTPIGAAAMTLGHTILGQNESVLDIARDHEHVHVRQYERWGPFFIPAYTLCSLWLLLRGKEYYRNNPFEIEAYSLDEKRRAFHDPAGVLGAGELPAVRTNHELYQIVLVSTFVPFCWLAFMVVHELGHVLGAWLTGGTVTQVVLNPVGFSQTLVSPNPNPIEVTWAGPLFGSAAPLTFWLVFRLGNLPGEYLVRFFAGGCLVANGGYIGAGSFFAAGDSKLLIDAGSPVHWQWLFGVLAFSSGLWMWHGLGKHFGFGENGKKIEAVSAFASLGLLVVTFTFMWLWCWLLT